jgi:dephospho-CoA kinase
MKLIYCITGMPGSGKSLVSKTACSVGYRVIAMGDIVREEAESRGIAKTPATLGKIMLELREMEGKDAIAKRCLEKAMKEPDDAVIEGVRSMEEMRYFMKNSDVFIIAVHASPKTRFSRLLKRGREDDPSDWATFSERDARELGVGIGSVIAMADKIFINEGTIRALKGSARCFFEGMRRAG